MESGCDEKSKRSHQQNGSKLPKGEPVVVRSLEAYKVYLLHKFHKLDPDYNSIISFRSRIAVDAVDGFPEREDDKKKAVVELLNPFVEAVRV